VTAGVLAVATLATLILGVSKTGVPSVGAFGIAVLALVMPPVESSGVVLPVLIVGDLVALSLYGRHADWRVLRRLVPSVVVGVVLGYLALRLLDEGWGGRLVGALLVAAGLGEVVRRWAVRRAAQHAAAEGRGPGWAPEPPPGRGHAAVQHALGAAAGLSTMVANAGGPPMTLYLLRARLSTAALMGTTTWFFFVVNLIKVPFSAGLGLITAQSLPTSAALLPGLLAGAALGWLFAARVSRALFEAVALGGATVAGLWLLVR